MEDFYYLKGRCLECDISIPPGQILCKKHREISTTITVTKAKPEVRLADMVEDDSGYVEEYAIFEVDSKLYVIGTAIAAQMPDRYKTVYIKVKRGIFEVDRQTIDTNDIYIGWPDMNDEPDCYQAKLV